MIFGEPEGLDWATLGTRGEELASRACENKAAWLLAYRDFSCIVAQVEAMPLRSAKDWRQRDHVVERLRIFLARMNEAKFSWAAEVSSQLAEKEKIVQLAEELAHGARGNPWEAGRYRDLRAAYGALGKVGPAERRLSERLGRALERIRSARRARRCLDN